MMTSRAPWLGNYDRGVPTTLAPYPNRTILDFITDQARTRPDAPALLFKGARVSWARLERESDIFAAALTALGIVKGDRIGLLLPNCPQFFVAELAAWKIGAIVAPLNPIYTEHELEGPLRDNGIETVVTLTRFYERVCKVRPRTPVKRVIATNIKEYFPGLLKFLFTLVREKKDGDRVAIAPSDFVFSELMRKHRSTPFERTALTQDDAAVLLMSGGTTGTPKGVLGRHGAYVLTGLQVEAWTASVVSKGDSVLMLPLPMFHVYANVGVQSLAFVTGNPLALVPNPRDLKDLLATIKREKPVFLTGVPTLFIGILNHPDVQAGKVDFSSIKICFSGAAALLADTKTRFEAITGGRIIEGYSLTEAMMALCVNPVEGPNKLGSVGMPLPDVYVRIYDGEEGREEMPVGEMGEICFGGAQLMVGFWNRPARAAGYTRAISATSTRTATCSSWTARRTSSRRAATRCGRARWKRPWLPIRRWRRWVSPAFPTRPRAKPCAPGWCFARDSRPLKPSCVRSAANGWRPTRCRARSSSGATCPRPWWARSCAGP